MTNAATTALIKAEALKPLIGAPSLRILDASYGLPPATVGIGNAVDFDIDTIASPDAPLAHTLPSAEVFAQHMNRMGIHQDDHIVVYDRAGLHMAAARAWWMFRVFGHQNVQVLDGGLPYWMGQGYPVMPKNAASAIEPKDYQARFQPQLVKSREDIQQNLTAEHFTVLDARDPSRYNGTAAEPRPGMDSGHIPGSLNFPFASLLDPSSGLLRPADDIASMINALGLETSAPVAISCGSGVTACVVALALHQTGQPAAAVYDGSWAEWGADTHTPKNKGSQP